MNKGISLLQEGNGAEAIPLLEETFRIAVPPLRAIAHQNYRYALKAVGQEFEVRLLTERQLSGE